MNYLRIGSETKYSQMGTLSRSNHTRPIQWLGYSAGTYAEVCSSCASNSFILLIIDGIA